MDRPKRTTSSLGRRPLQAIAALLLALALAACGGGPTPADPRLELSVDPGSLAILRGGAAAELRLSVALSGGAEGPVTLSASGVPAGVTLSFEPPTLSGGVLEATVLLSASAAAAEGDHPLRISAEAAALSATADLDLEVASLSLQGRVLGLQGLGTAGVQVHGQGSSTTTDADGRFVLDGLSIPYELTLVQDDGSEAAVHVFRGLSSATPMLEPYFALAAGAPGPLASVGGTVLGGEAVPAGQRVLVCAEGLDRVVYGCTSVAAGASSYAVSLAWRGAQPADVRLHALRIETRPDGGPAAYHGYVTAELEVAPGDEASVDLDASSTVASSTFRAEIVDAGGGSDVEGRLGLRVGPNLLIPIATVRDAEVEVTVPSGPGFSYDLVLEQGNTRFAWRGSLGPEAGALTLPLAPVHLAPANGAAAVGPTTPFRALRPEGHSLTFLWRPQAAGPQVALTILDGDQVTLPDLAEAGLNYPAGAAYRWSAYAAPLPSPAAGGDLPGILRGYDVIIHPTRGGPAAAGDGSLLATDSPDRTFTLAD